MSCSLCLGQYCLAHGVEGTEMNEAGSPTPFVHLHPDAVNVAKMDVQERIEYIKTDRWLPYRRANEILATLEELLSSPRVNRPQSMMLLARSGNGKSHILRRFAETHPGQPNLHGLNIIAPVMLLETQPSAKERDLYRTILYMLNCPMPRGSGVEECRDAAVSILRTVQIKVLLVDEVNNLLSASPARQREYMFALKYLSNVLQISIVVAGTPESRQLIRLSDQLENRFRLETLPIWNDIGELRVLLANFEQVLPLREPSKLSRRSTASLISSFNIETIGDVSALLSRAAVAALSAGEESITEERLQGCAPMTRQSVKQMLANV